MKERRRSEAHTCRRQGKTEAAEACRSKLVQPFNVDEVREAYRGETSITRNLSVGNLERDKGLKLVKAIEACT